MPEADSCPHSVQGPDNECALFKPRVTVARDAAQANNGQPAAAPPPAPRNSSDARTAFDNLFKKPS